MADTSKTYTVLEKDFTQTLSQDGKPLGFSTADPVSLFTSTSFLYSLGIMVSVVAAGFMYARAGLYRMQASERGVSKSNEEIKRTTFGLLGILALFVIIYTFNKDLLTGDVGLKELKLNPVAGGSALGTGSTASSSASSTQATSTPAPTGSASYQQRLESHNAAVARLAPSGIHTNYNDAPCTEAQFSESKPSCTSLAFLPEETIQMLLRINGSCGCTLVITGGTEPGHSSHGENKRPVDLRLTGPRGNPNNTDPIYQYIKGVATNRFGPSSNCFERYIYSTFTFCDEVPPNPQHFHVY
jgi:hypothetical protein